MGWALVGSGLGGSAADTVFTSTLAIPVTQAYAAGDTVFAYTNGGGGGSPAGYSSCSDDAVGNTWVLDETLSTISSAVFRCELATPLATTNTVTVSWAGGSGNARNGCIFGFSGLADSAHEEVATTSTYEGTGTWTTGPTAAVAEDHPLVLALLSTALATSPAPPTGYSLIGSMTASGNPLYVYYKDGGLSGATESATFTLSGGDSVDAMVLVFTPSGGTPAVIFVPKIIQYG